MIDSRSTLALLKDRMAAHDRAGINAAAIALIDQRAALGPQWAAVATLLQHHGEHRAALRALDTWLTADGPQPRILFARAATLARAGRPAEAREQLDRLARDFPDTVGNAYLRGTIATNLGDQAAAIHALQQAVAFDPYSGQSWLARAMAGSLDAREAQALRAARSLFGNLETADAAAYFYGLGKLEDDRGEHDAAFAAFAHGARTMHRLQPYDAAGDRAIADTAIADWDRTAIDEVRSAIRASVDRPIFVTGLPRSGTTLVEQIIASHSAIAGGAELGLFSIIGRDVGALSHGAFQAWRARGGEPQALRDLYHHLARQRFPAPGRIIDKTLATSRHIGLIAALFPDAPIVWLRRDPLDCAWSAFRSYFVKGVEWSWSLESIAQFFTQEDRLFDHWIKTLGDQILVIPFDELVSDPELWVRRIDDHAGLTIEPAQFAPHRTERAVITNSAAQVREPIHHRGIGSAEPYRAHLGEFIELYPAAMSGQPQFRSPRAPWQP